MNNLVSVIIPTHNRKDILKETLASVFQQTLTPLEIIVIDDASSDGTFDWIQTEFPTIRILRNEISKGGAGARNQGAELANGDYIAFLDSDDQWLPNHLEDKITLIQKENADGAFGNFYLDTGEDLKEIKFGFSHTGGGSLAAKLFSDTRFDARTSTFVFNRSSFKQVRFDDKLRKHQDWDLAVNFDRQFKFVASETPTVKLKVDHGGERMSQKPKHDASFYFIEKNKGNLTADQQFHFSLKRIMQSQEFREDQSIKYRYLDLIKDRRHELSPSHKILYALLKSNLINLHSLYKLSKSLKLK